MITKVGQGGLRKRGLAIFGIAISAICGYFAIRGINWEDVLHAFASVHVFQITIAFIFLAVSYCLMARRWQLLIGHNQISWCDVLAALMVGLMVNNIVPARLGEIARAVFLGIREDISKAYLMGTVVLDRLMDLVVLISIAFLLFSSMWILPGFLLGVIVLGGLLLGGGVTLISFFRWDGKERLFNLTQPGLSTHTQRLLAGVISQLQLSLTTRRSWSEWCTVVALSLGAWFFMGNSLFFALKAFNINLNLYEVGILLVVLNLGGMIPSSPGYIGTYHWLAVTTLTAFGIDQNTALSFALVNHVLWYVPQILVGLGILVRAHMTVRTLTGSYK